MRKNWLLIGVGLLVAVLAIGAIACGDDDDDGDTGDPTAVENGNGNGNGEVLLLSVTLTGPDASGTADITVSGEGIQVTLSMAGLGEGEGVHANHLHHGTCDDQGVVHITLLNLVADAEGNATATTSDDEQPLSHFETGHYLAVHEAGGSPGPVISCGDVVA